MTSTPEHAIVAAVERAEDVGASQKSLAEQPTGQQGQVAAKTPKQADLLIQIAASADLFHAPDSTGYADVQVDGHRETWPIRSKGFRRWLTRQFFRATDGAPGSEALQSALNVIEARAHFDSPQRAVYIRVAGHDGRLYLDLVDDGWRAVEIGPDGWRIVDEPPVRFRRAAGMQPVSVPRKGGSVEALRRYVNVGPKAFVLVVSWLLAALRNCGPYPVLALAGEQGSAKSTLSRILRMLLDPNSAPLRALPRDDRDLFIAASNSHVLTFDNVSGLRGWISDTLCRLASGGGFAVRRLYTDMDEVLFDAARPTIVNGIDDIITRPDLAARAILLTLEPIPEDKRLAERELWAAFERDAPQILGALLDAASLGLRRLPETRLERLPRMADFAHWVAACEPALWPAGTFLAVYEESRADAVDSVIEADPVGSAVRSFMTSRHEWTGTAKELLCVLGDEAGDVVRQMKVWPTTPRALSGRLRRAATFLRATGLEVGFSREGRNRTRTITMSTAEGAGTEPSAPSAFRGERLNSEDAGRTGVPSGADGADGADGPITPMLDGWGEV